MDELFPQQEPRQSPMRIAQAPELAAQVTGLATRLKLAEERYANLAKRNQLTEESLLQFEREFTAELRATLQQVTELRRKVAEIDQKVDAIQGELSGFVRKHEFATVERYLDLWQPMRFLTRDEAKRLIADAQKGGGKGA
jgi:uncharacterized protein YhaN